MEIKVEHQPTQATLDQMGVLSWPIWTKEVSEFPWVYDAEETCYFLAGDVLVTPKQGEAVRVGQGDLVTFPVGLACTWKVIKSVRKHYRFA
jgi:uncharacterized protein